jgi:hypothetical protein
MALTYNEINSVTEKYFHPKLVDNIFTSNTLLSRAKSKGWLQTIDGGEKILIPLAYATTTAGGWYSGSESLNTSNNDQVTAAEFDWKFDYANVTITRGDELKNSGKAQMVNLVKAKVQLAEKTLSDSIGTGLYNDGSTLAKAIVGLRLAVDSAGTYAGISRTTYSWWAAQEDSTTTALSIGLMQGLMGDCTQGSSKPSVITTTQDIFDDLFGLLQPLQRYTDSKTADAGFQNLMFAGTPVIVDNHCPASHMFFLNEDYIHLLVHKDENFRFEPFQKPINQNVSCAKVYVALALAISNCRMHAKLGAIA